MTEIRLRYVVRRRGKLFWQPTPEMRVAGFLAKPLGPDGPEAQTAALKLLAAWDKIRVEGERVTAYPPGTLGAYWDRLRGTKKEPAIWWTKKKPRTREDYERAWRYIDEWRPRGDLDGAPRPTLSRTVITQISTELCEQFYAHLDGTVSQSERWRAIKGLKILLADAVVRLRLGYESPAAKLVNPQPAGRSQIWLGAEIDMLAKDALALGYEGMSLALRLAWETLFSPVDVWTLRPHQLKRDTIGWYVERERTKTSKAAFAMISDVLAADLADYIGRQARAEADETPILRQRNGQAYSSKDTFGDDFRAVRAKRFAGDDRRFMDIRRSGNVEADAAGADKKTMGEILANGLADNRFLDDTYTPPTVAKARDVAAQRIQGRAMLAGELVRVRNKG